MKRLTQKKLDVIKSCLDKIERGYGWRYSPKLGDITGKDVR